MVAKNELYSNGTQVVFGFRDGSIYRWMIKYPETISMIDLLEQLNVDGSSNNEVVLSANPIQCSCSTASVPAIKPGVDGG
jgi:hypothetical protein